MGLSPNNWIQNIGNIVFHFQETFTSTVGFFSEFQVTSKKFILHSAFRFGHSAALNPALATAVLALAGIFIIRDPGLGELAGVDLNRPLRVSAKVEGIPEKLPHGIRVRLQPLQITQGGKRIDYRKKLILNLPHPSRKPRGSGRDNIFLGDTVRFRGKLQRPAFNLIPGVIDRRVGAENRGTPFQVRLKSHLQLERTPPGPGFKSRMFVYLRDFVCFIERQEHPDTEKLLRALFLGQKSALEATFRNKTDRLGISHLFVISGLHIGILISFLYIIFGGSSRGILLTSALFGVTWSYIWLLGFPIPAVRAGILASIGGIFLQAGVQKRIMNILGMAALVLLARNPNVAFTPSFQLTFGCIIGIVLLAVPLGSKLNLPLLGYQRFLRQEVNPSFFGEERAIRLCHTWSEDYFRHLPSPAARAIQTILALLIRLLQLALCTAAIQLFLFPVIIYYFNSFNLFSLSGTIIFLPIIILLIIDGTILFLLWWTPLGKPLFFLYHYTGETISQAIDYLDKTFSPIYLAHPEPVFIFIFYLLLLTLLFVNPSRGWVFPSLFLAAWFCGGPANQDPVPTNHLEVNILDVGQGDAIHIGFPDGRHAMIDLGGTVFQDNRYHVGKNLIGRYLWERNIHRLKYVLISHPEMDHYAGFRFLNETFIIDRFFCHDDHPSYPEDAIRLQRGDSFILGRVHHRILWPPARTDPPLKNLNDRSLVLLLTYGNFKLLLTGDISSRIEGILMGTDIPKEITTLKAAHHGSAYSSDKKFLALVQPRIAVISAGRRNPFGHPAPAVIQRLKDIGARVFDTPRHGSIRIVTDGITWTVGHETAQRRGPVD